MKKKILSIILTTMIAISMLFIAQLSASAATTYNGDSITISPKANGKADTYSKTFKDVKTISVPGHTFSVYKWNEWNCSKSDYVNGYISSRVIKNKDNSYKLYLWSRANMGTGTIKVSYNNGEICNYKYTVAKQSENITLDAKVSKADTYSKTFKDVKTITVPGHTFCVYKWNEWHCSKSDYVDGYISSRVVKNSNGTYTLYLWSRAKSGTDNIEIAYNNGEIYSHNYTVEKQADSITLGAKGNGKADTITKTFKDVKTITVPGHTFCVYMWDEWNCSKSDYVNGYISSRVVKNGDNTYTLYLWSRANTGTGSIEAVYNNGKVYKHAYTVKNAPTSVKLSENTLSLKSGDTFTITESTPNAYANGSNLVWSSSNPEIATVTKGSGNKAEIKATGSGEATITLTTYNGISASCVVKVNWHDAIYKTVEHPAETEQVWIVDKEAYTYDEPIYEEKGACECLVCGRIYLPSSTEDEEHLNYHIQKGDFDKVHYRVITMKVQVGTNTITVPEEGHYETKVIKEAWTEKVLVKEAGYY